MLILVVSLGFVQASFQKVNFSQIRVVRFSGDGRVTVAFGPPWASRTPNPEPLNPLNECSGYGLF